MFDSALSFLDSHLSDVLGVCGFVLGIVNFVFVVWKSRVRLRLSVSLQRPFTPCGTKSEHLTFRWNIVNLSTFDIYINSIGVCSNIRNPETNSYEVPDLFFDGVKFPFKLHSREASLLSVSSSQIPELRNYKYMYVFTSCGKSVIKRVPYSVSI